jgi:hypothetical protein
MVATCAARGIAIIEILSTWLQDNQASMATLAAISALFWIGTLIAVPIVIVRLPADYLNRKERWFPRNPKPAYWQYPYIFIKNIFGILFIIAGLAMLVLPGQGLLTLALGLALINFPKKHRLIRRILGQKRILRAINRLRHRAKKPPLVLQARA